jgi:hypothetical protein
MSEQTLKIGDQVTYETLDEEYYSRGYGVIMETKKTTIVGIKYIMQNGDEIRANSRSLQKVMAKPSTAQPSNQDLKSTKENQ